ncbi:hypothetical protein J23TS9_23510 [Paenibacillus sp. J23TS9]|nr:hypothetical protein J23TS9_23510 [Paenibacillus sp. J23TS9]
MELEKELKEINERLNQGLLIDVRISLMNKERGHCIGVFN